MRVSHERAQASGLSGPKLALLFEEAGRLAAAVRGGTQLGVGSVSLAAVALAHVRRRVQRSLGLIVLIGVSAMTERAARSLADERLPFVVVNRSAQRGRALAERFGATFVSLDDFRRAPPRAAAVLPSTGARHAVLGERELERLVAEASGEPPLCAVPADIEPAACARFGIRRIGMDER